MVLGRGGMVCTSQALASAAGADVLRRGGNAVDAAVCAAAVLGVVEPFSTGIGGDCFMLIWSATDRALYGLNGSGRAPAGLSLETLRERGANEIPVHGMLPVTIPGAVDAWCAALQGRCNGTTSPAASMRSDSVAGRVGVATPICTHA